MTNTNRWNIKDKLEEFSKQGTKNISIILELIRTTQNVQSINPGHNIKMEKLRHYGYLENYTKLKIHGYVGTINVLE